MASPPLPNFFLAGAPKAGTTSLYHYLDQHPQIYMSPLKEPHFFSEEFRAEHWSDELRPLIASRAAGLRKFLDGPMTRKYAGGPVDCREDYLRLFRGVQGHIAIGEASVSYLWSASALRNIAAQLPQARIVAVLRNPAERAFSQYLHLLAVHPVARSFAAYLAEGLRAPRDRIGLAHPFLEFGLYARQLRNWGAHFPADQMRVYFYEDYQADAAALVRDVFQFLGVDPAFVPDMAERHLTRRLPRYPAVHRALKRSGIWERARNSVPAGLRKTAARALFRPPGIVLEARERAQLIDYYRQDIGALAELTGRDLSAWLQV